ncbi:MAG TPA: EAL domain-containing protein [Pseudomonas sp.]|nr:EAL domain-containing protein [Pseudomonas sp.]
MPIAQGRLDLQAGRRLLLAIAAAGVFSLLTCSAFYLFEIERLTSRQLAALAHYAGQSIHAADLGWQRAVTDGEKGAAGDPSLSWQYDATGQQISRVATLRLPGGRSATRRFPVDNAWLAADNRPDLRLYLVGRGRVLASSLGAAGAGEASALEPQVAGRIARQDALFVQAPMRWDDQADSPLLVVQQRLSLPFSLGEIALAGLFLWGILAGLIWLTVGIWLHKALQQIQFLAYHDPLTGLINRAALRVGLAHMLAESRRNHTLLAIFYLDLDRFKIINDSLGHAVGDLVLKESAQRLLACVRDTDFVARLGGDEFIVLVGELTGANDAAAIARKIIASLAEPIRVNGQLLQTGCSIGIATHPGSVADPDDLIKQADSAMYAAKQMGRGRYHYYDASLGAKADLRLSLELRMREALGEGGFAVHYQPVVSGQDGMRLNGFEALLRWRCAGQDISPAEFIPLAEETGLIVPLGEWVLRQACTQMRAWQQEFGQCQGLSMSVNVSVRQLHAGDFAERVAKALRDSGLPPSSLILELTESLYVDRHTAIPDTLRRLQDMGVRLAMDDFGTGYSSLANLTRLPIDRLKIDRSFVCNITTTAGELAIAHTIIAIGQQLGLEIVAEGVETAQQAALLNGSGCHIQQGWLFGRPAAADDIAQQLFSAPALEKHATSF